MMREFIAIILLAAFFGFVAQLPQPGKGPHSHPDCIRATE